MLMYQDMKTNTVAGWKSMTAAQLLELARGLRALAAHTTLPRLRTQLLRRASLREAAAR